MTQEKLRKQHLKYNIIFGTLVTLALIGTGTVAVAAVDLIVKILRAVYGL
jgi:hypothetical protein